MDYGNGESFSGTEFTDFVTIGSNANLVIFGQSIGAATDSSGFDDSDGILGCDHLCLMVATSELTSVLELGLPI